MMEIISFSYVTCDYCQQPMLTYLEDEHAMYCSEDCVNGAHAYDNGDPAFVHVPTPSPVIIECGDFEFHADDTYLEGQFTASEMLRGLI